MAAVTCLACTVKCSAQSHQKHEGVGKIKTAIASTVKPLMKELKKSAVKIDASQALKTASQTVLNAFVDSAVQFVDIPLLPSQRNFAPVDEIGDIVNNLAAQGELPPDFPEGIYVRNGANPLFGGLKSTKSMFGRSENIWVEGEGMLHALYITKDSSGNWCFAYNNKYVETETFKMESQRPKPAFLPAVHGDSSAILAAYFLNMSRFGEPNKILSNTNVFEYGGKYYSVAENFLPQEFDLFSLKTLGNMDLNGAWPRPFTSHPKKAPGTGELVIMGFDGKKPYCVMGVVSDDGKELIHKFDMNMNRCTFFHDFGVTEKYNIMVDHPLIVDGDRLAKGGPLIKYEKEKEARIGVIPRYGNADSIKWFPVESCCSFHIINSYEDGDEVILRGCKSNASVIPGPDWGADKQEWFSRGFKPVDDQSPSTEQGMLFTSVREWKLNMATGNVKERDLTGTGLSLDFPMINEDFVGIKHKYGYAQVLDLEASATAGRTKYGGLAKLHFEEGATKDAEQQRGEQIKIEYHEFQKNNYCTGSAFVPKPGAVEEDDGWIITFVHDEGTDKSHVLIVDAKRLEEDPIMKISLPQRVPYGHHGAFFPLLNNIRNNSLM